MEFDLTTLILFVGNGIVTFVTAFVAVRVSIARLEERLLVLRKDVDDVERTIYGNGHAGIKHDVHEHEATLRDHDRRLSCVEVKVA